MNSRLVGSVIAALGAVLAHAHAPAQEPAAGQDPKAIAAAVEKWLASTHDSPELLDATVKVVLADAPKGIAHVGALLRERDPDSRRGKAMGQLATSLALRFLQRESSRDIAYAGQYKPLLPLQPFVGDLYFSWLLATPDWFPDTHRITLVPALRDLQPKRPDRAKVEGVRAIVENEEIEPENLRAALACMLWQWGEKERAQKRVDALVRASTEGEIEDRARALLGLANLWYDLRDYKASAVAYDVLQSLAAGSDLPLKPVDWYSAACSYALSGKVEQGIEALAKCAELQASRDVDSSWKVQAVVFDEDPEIGALRGHPRFAAIVAQAKKGSGEVAADPWKKRSGK